MINGFNKRIMIQKAIKSEDDSGGYSIAWTDLKETWCKFSYGHNMKYSSGYKFMDNGQILIRYPVEVTLYWMNDLGQYNADYSTIDPYHFRLIYNGKVINIVSLVNVDENNFIITILGDVLS